MMMKHAVLAGVVAAAAGSSVSFAGDPASLRFEPVVWRGDVVADQPDAPALAGFETVILNDAGFVGLNVQFTSPGSLDRAVLSIDSAGASGPEGAAARTLLRWGHQVGAAADQITFGSVWTRGGMNLTADGGFVGTVFVEGPQVTGANEKAIVRGGAAPLGVVARANTPLSDGTSPFFLDDRMVANDAGRIAFLGSSGFSPGVLCVEEEGGVRRAAAVGQQLTAYPGYTMRSLAMPVIANTGEIYFRGNARFTTTGMPEKAGVWKVGATEPVPVLVGGDPAPGVANGVINSTFCPSVSTDGAHLAVVAYADNGPGLTQGIWRVSGDDVQMVHSTEMDVPGQAPGTRFLGYGESVSVNSRGDVSFTGLMRIEDRNRFGLFLSQGQEIHTLIVEGQQALNAAAGTLAGPRPGSGTMNDLGQVVFEVTLTGEGVTGFNDAALYAWDPMAGLFEVIREGKELTIDGELKTVASYNFETGLRVFGLNGENPGGNGGTSSGFNNLGQLALGINFTDGTSGVFLTQIPAPGALAVAAAVGLMGMRRRR